MQNLQQATTQQELEKAIQEDMQEISYFLDCECSMEDN